MTSRSHGVAAWLATVSIAVAMVGCGRPQAAPQNQQLITTFRTAVSARKPDWLEANIKVLEERRAAGQVSDEEYETFQAIIQKAQAGQWEKAEKEAIAFQKAQRPTAEQIERVKKHRP